MAVKPTDQKSAHAAKVSRLAQENSVPVKSTDQKASCTIKISRLVRNFIEEKATLIEPTDRTLRRLLGLKLQKGEFSPKPRGEKNGEKPVAPWTTIKVTVLLRDHIISCAKWNESVDHTLRRLLKLPFEPKY